MRRSVSGFDALAALRTMRFDAILADDSCGDMKPLEFVLNVRDMVKNDPVIMIGGAELGRFTDVWAHCRVFYAGEKSAIPGRIPECVQRA